MNEGEPVLYYVKDGPKREFAQEELQIVPPGTELSPKVFRWCEKKKLLKLSFLVHPSNPGDSIQETDRDMNNIKIANLANPTDNEDATNKKYVDEKTETIDFFPFFVKICRQKSFHWDIHKKKQHAGITQTTTQTVKYIIKMNVITFDQSGLINHATQNKKYLRRPRISSLNSKERHFFSFTKDRVFDLLFKFPLLYRKVSLFLLSWIKTDGPWIEQMTN